MSAARPADPIRLPWVLSAVSFLWIAGFLVTAAAVIVAAASGGKLFGDMLNVLCVCLGVQGAGAIIVLGFWFGSSFGSYSKSVWAYQDGGVVPPDVKLLPAPDGQPGEGDQPAPGEEPETEPPALYAGDDKFARVHAVIAKEEGGYSNHPSDKGGPTNFGITQKALAAWRGHAVTAADVKAMTYAEALLIFRARYWTPLCCDELQIGVALMTYNAGVNNGIGDGARFLQECLNKQGSSLNVDGKVGPLTLAAARKADVPRLITDYAARHEADYRGLSDFSTFGNSWLNRLKRVTAQAKAWATEPLPPVVAPPPSQTDLAAVIILAMQRKGYVVDTEPGQVNIIYVEGLNADGTVNNDAPDRWNDLRCVIGFESGNPVMLGKWQATTEPGRYYTDNPVNTGGAARIAFGQYQAWRVGIHRSDHEALVQRAEVTVCRDLNKDMIRTGDRRDTGLFGINQHGPSGTEEAGDSVGKFSAGCLVGKTMAGHRAFMSIVKSDPRFIADPDFLFRTAILAEADVVVS